MAKQHIAIISFGYISRHFLDRTAEAVKLHFNHPVSLVESHLDLSSFFDPGRRQYNGNKLLKTVDSMAPPGSLKTIGLFSVDLFIPILTYIFGQAALSGKSGIASLYRLSNERYGMEPDDRLLLERFSKEVIHELGHTFGLIHCDNPVCVMRSSTYVEDIDQKGTGFCNSCRNQLSPVISDQ